MSESIHDYDMRMRSVLKSLDSHGSISSANKRLILEFRDECFANGLSKARVIKYLYYLIKLAEWLGKDFRHAREKDMKKLITKVEQSPYVDFSKKELKTCTRKFYKWLRKTDDYPPEVKWIKPSCKRIAKMKLPEELLTEDDVKRLVNAARNPRDRAFVSMLYETGCRIGEILFIRNKHLHFDQYGAVVIVSGKTGSRRLRIISSVPYLASWLNEHPQREDPDAFVWTCGGDGALSYGRVLEMLKFLGKSAGIKKRLNPHNFRHSRATFLANHLTEAQMKEYFGWVRSSDMAAVYVHLSGRDVDSAILKLHGIANGDGKEESTLTPKQCPRCELKNQATNKYCSRCGIPLDQEAMLRIIDDDLQKKEADRIMDELVKDERFREFLLTKTRALMDSNLSRRSFLS